MPEAAVRAKSSNRAVVSRPLLTVDEAAERLGMTPRWVRRQVAERTIPHLKLRGLLRFDPDALDAWLAEQVVPAEEG